MAAEDGRGEKEGADAAAARKAKRQGGFRTMPFILGE
jgi:hypothetical protein